MFLKKKKKNPEETGKKVLDIWLINESSPNRAQVCRAVLAVMVAKNECKVLTLVREVGKEVHMA